MVAKWVADTMVHPLYHALLEVKAVPFLLPEPVSKHSLDLVPVRAVMHAPVVTLRATMRAADLQVGAACTCVCVLVCVCVFDRVCVSGSEVRRAGMGGLVAGSGGGVGWHLGASVRDHEVRTPHVIVGVGVVRLRVREARD
jgi:hypothetical protein